LTSSLIGESYMHGIMDGEIMGEKREEEQFALT
jgi:hypothetical protein